MAFAGLKKQINKANQVRNQRENTISFHFRVLTNCCQSFRFCYFILYFHFSHVFWRNFVIIVKWCVIGAGATLHKVNCLVLFCRTYSQATHISHIYTIVVLHYYLSFIRIHVPFFARFLLLLLLILFYFLLFLPIAHGAMCKCGMRTFSRTYDIEWYFCFFVVCAFHSMSRRRWAVRRAPN